MNPIEHHIYCTVFSRVVLDYLTERGGCDSATVYPVDVIPCDEDMDEIVSAADRIATAVTAAVQRSRAKTIAEVSDLVLSTHCQTVLARNKITTIPQLCTFTEQGLLRILGLGRGTLGEIKRELARVGLQLRSENA